ncbi:hypothetical protein KN1_09110 [Stygiolobus caldivivus]|uniref:Uncharacterized protein n=2 Tax=Stygiolobus caldivivus TaxID=2824673 RepID=A0A8D5ZHD9_9CREN|nr:hypothetical protein KN1_09110 [Stygiolobus caldivivus]
MRGISNSIVALILVIASVIITLVTVGFTFAILGSNSSSIQVTQVGSPIISGNEVVFTLKSTSSVKIVKVYVNYPNDTAVKILVNNQSTDLLSPGLNKVVAEFNFQIPQNAEIYVVTSNSEVIPLG